MAASRILALARTNRWATVASGWRNARAISTVCSPHTRRSVRATCAAESRAGWQQVKINRSWSSAGSGSASPPGSNGSNGSLGSASGRAPSAAFSFASRHDSRRAPSRARFRAAVVIQAPGLSGTPRRGQVRIASTNAS
jgi:hypothetical protein